MKLKRAVLAAMDREQLKAAVDELGLDVDDRRSVRMMRARLQRAHRARPELLLHRLSEVGVKEVCEALGLPSRGRKAGLIKGLLSGESAADDAECPDHTEAGGTADDELPGEPSPVGPAELPEGAEDFVVEPEEAIGADVLTEPFNPSNIRIEARMITVDLLVRRIQQNEIDLAPAFQRQAGIWKDEAQSRLIESLLVRIPIPAFYVDATNDERWLVVDGLQRLTVFRRFIVDQQLTLSGLEFLHDYKDKTYRELPRSMQRRIDETQVTVFLMLPGTDPAVKFHIFRRINTGGLPLSPQEIRHALYQGEGAAMLERIVRTDVFQSVAGMNLRAQRMTDREMALRFLAFVLTPPREYPGGDLDSFLNRAMQRLNESTQEVIASLEERFARALSAAYAIFGNDAFRKRTSRDDPRKPISKALFEAWAVNLDARSDEEIAWLAERHDQVTEAFIHLMISDRDFAQAISQGTGDKNKVLKRFGAVRAIIEEVLS